MLTIELTYVNHQLSYTAVRTVDSKLFGLFASKTSINCWEFTHRLVRTVRTYVCNFKSKPTTGVVSELSDK